MKRSVVALSAALVAACLAGPAAADIVCPDSSYVEVSYSQTYPAEHPDAGTPLNHIYTHPAGDGRSFAANGIDVRVYLKNCQGEPLIGVPAQEIVMFNSNLCICPGGGASDAGTDSNGCATWTGSLASGGCVPTVDVYADGIFIATVSDGVTDLRLNSTDQAHAGTSPCFTDASDLAAFAQVLGTTSTGKFCFDFIATGNTIDPADLGAFAEGLGKSCL